MSFLKRRAPLRHVKAVRLHTFVLEQPHLARETARVTGEAPIGSYYAMAGDDDADGIMAHRSPHGQGRRASSAALLCYLLGEGSVRCHLAVGDLCEQSPYQALELAADGRERNLLKGRTSAGEVGVEPRAQLVEAARLVVTLQFPGDAGAVVLLPLEPQAADSLAVARQRQPSYR